MSKRNSVSALANGPRAESRGWPNRVRLSLNPRVEGVPSGSRAGTVWDLLKMARRSLGSTLSRDLSQGPKRVAEQ
jgi:hypothetical protein